MDSVQFCKLVPAKLWGLYLMLGLNSQGGQWRQEGWVSNGKQQG